MDKLLSEKILNFHGQIEFVDNFFIILADYSAHFFFLSFIGLLIYIYVYYKNSRYQNIIFSGIVLLCSLAVNNIIRAVVTRERPFVAVEAFNALINHSATNSFPSNHATASLAVAGIIYFFKPKIGITFIIISILVAFSRVYVGVHYISDVAVGILISTTVLYLSIKNKNRLLTLFSKLNLRNLINS